VTKRACLSAAAPESANRIVTIEKRVDSDYFSPRARPRVAPSRPTSYPIVFTGTMDYWPNVDAVAGFRAGGSAAHTRMTTAPDSTSSA